MQKLFLVDGTTCACMGALLFPNSLSHSLDWVDSRRACILQTYTHVSMYECTFVCKRFCFNFAATAHTHSHNHCHMERCSFNDIGVFVCKIQKTRPAPFHLPQSSIDHMTGTRDHYDYLLMLSASLGNGSRGCRGRGAGRRRGMRGSHIITCERHNRCRASDAHAMYTFTHIHTHNCTYGTSWDLHGPGNAKAKAKRPRLQAAVATSWITCVFVLVVRRPLRLHSAPIGAHSAIGFGAQRRLRPL